MLRKIFVAMLFCTTACTPEELSSPTKQQALNTKGTLPDPNGGAFRRFRHPLDAIAPEDPPLPNRGLIAHIPLPGTCLPNPQDCKLGKVGEKRAGVGAGPGVLGSAMGANNQGGSIAVAFGDGEFTNGGNITLSGIGVDSQGWSVAYFAGLPSDASPKSLLSTFNFSNRKPIQVFADSASKQLALSGVSAVPNQEIKINATFGPKEFHHVVVNFTPLNRAVFTGKDPGTLAVYFDGQLVHTEPGTFGSLSQIVFGSTKIGTTEVLSYALMDDIFAFRTSLAEGEIQALAKKAEKGVVRVWPVSMPVNVLDAAPYTQARANAANAVVGTYALAGPAERHDDDTIAAEFADFQHFTFAGWYFVPEDAPKNLDLFSIRADNQGLFYVRLAVEGQVPYAEIKDGNGTDRITGGSRFVVTRGAWHFIVLTRSWTSMRLYVDSELTAEMAPGVPPFLFATLGPPTYRFSYGIAPTAWIVALNKQATISELEALRSPGPHIWLDGSNAEVTVGKELGAVASSGFVGPLDANGTAQSAPEVITPDQKTRRVVAPNDYGGHCYFDTESETCDPVATYGGVGGVSVGREGSIRLNRELAGRVQIAATPLWRDKLGVSFRLFVEGGTDDVLPIFTRDFPSRARGLANDARIEASCFSGFFCVLSVVYPKSATATTRVSKSYPLTQAGWNRIAVGFNGPGGDPTVAINGELTESYYSQDITGEEGTDPASLEKEKVGRLRFGFDMREYSKSSATPFDIDDIRLYARALSPMEATVLTATCAKMTCDVSSRACVTGFTREATVLCGLCLPDSYPAVENNLLYGMTSTVCEQKEVFAAQCASDGQCESGVCIDSFCGSKDRATVDKECYERRRKVKGSGQRFTCDKCYDFHDPPIDGSPIGACVWKPTKKFDDVVGAGSTGSFDTDSTPGFDTYECNSGHAATTTERRFGVLPDTRLSSVQQQANGTYVKNRHAGGVSVDSGAPSELRSRCTPVMPDGCLQCETNPKPDFCTQDFIKNVCFKQGCKACTQNGQNCSTTRGYPICETCRPNFRRQRALLTPEACANVFNSLNDWQAQPSQAWNEQRYQWMFEDQPIPWIGYLKSMVGLYSDGGRGDYAELEKRGIGYPYTKFANLPFSAGCERWICIGTNCKLPEPKCWSNYDELYGDATRLVGGKSLHIYDCVLPDSAFQSTHNDEICVSVKSPKGAACPPINPQTGLPEEGDGDQFCETGYCGRAFGVCTDGGVQQEKAGRKDSAEESSSGFSIGVFGVNASSLVATKHDATSTGRTSVSRFQFNLVAQIMAFLDIEVFLFEGAITTNGVDDPNITTHYELLGASLPSDQKPVAACANAMWSDDGKWEGSGDCEINLDQPPGPPKLQVKFPVAEDAQEKYSKSRTFMAGPIPILVKGALVVDAAIGLDAGFSDAELEARFGVKPKFGVGVEVSGGIGGEFDVGPLTFGASAGLRAAITLIEIAFPAGWVMNIERETDETGKELNRFYISDRVEISVEMDILALAFSIYAELELGIFSIEWEYLIVELKNLTFKKSIFSGPKREFVLDFD